MRSGHLLIWSVKGLATLSLIAAVGTGAVYGLSWLAIYDKPASQSTAPMMGDLGLAGHTAEMPDNGTLRLKTRNTATLHLHGHDAHITSARFTRDGRSVLTVDANGHAHLSDVDMAQWNAGVGDLTQMNGLGETLMSAYVKPAAHASLALLSPYHRFEIQDCVGTSAARFCGPKMVIVPAGSFMMGSPKDEVGHDDDEGPQHEVTFTEPFAVAKVEVTRGQYAEFMAVTGRPEAESCRTESQLGKGDWQDRKERSWRNPGFPQDDNHPAVCVNWDDAKAFAAWLSKRTGHDYRLLTEAEWEYVARAGTTTAYSFKDGEKELGEYGWYAENSNNGTQPVGRKKPNIFGLHDMHGNVWEWTEDCWNENYDGAPNDGSAWTTGECDRRMARGGSWYGDPKDLRAGLRGKLSTDDRLNLVGFRLGRTLTARTGAITVSSGVQ